MGGGGGGGREDKSTHITTIHPHIKNKQEAQTNQMICLEFNFIYLLLLFGMFNFVTGQELCPLYA